MVSWALMVEDILPDETETGEASLLCNAGQGCRPGSRVCATQVRHNGMHHMRGHVQSGESEAKFIHEMRPQFPSETTVSV